MLFLDNRLLSSGEAYFNHSGSFYPTTNLYSGRYTYSLPYKQLVNDISISGATQMTGVSLNGINIGVGTSGLLNINHYQGTVDFGTQLPSSARLTANFAVKEANLYISSSSDDSLVFENKYFRNTKYSQSLSGLNPKTYPLPAIFLKNRGSEDKPFCLGSVDNTVIDVRAIVITDDPYLTDGICSILRDTHFRRFGLVTPPFDARQAFTGTLYNYDSLGPPASVSGALIQKVRVSKILNGTAGYGDNDIEVSFVDFEISQVRGH